MDSLAGNIFDAASLHRYLYVANDPVNNLDQSGHQTLGELSVSFGIVAGLTAAGYTAHRGGSALEIVTNGLAAGVAAGFAFYYGIVLAEAAIEVASVLRLYPYLIGPIIANTLSPVALRTLEKVKDINAKDAEIIARGMQLATAPGFEEDLAALNQALQQVVHSTSLQLNYLGQVVGSPVYGSTVTGVGIVSLQGTTMVVQMEYQQLQQILGPFR
jgi:hypothetical protein